MPTLQQTIAKKFLDELAGKEGFDAAKIESLRKLLAQTTKLKADEFVKVFGAGGGDVA